MTTSQRNGRSDSDKVTDSLVELASLFGDVNEFELQAHAPANCGNAKSVESSELNPNKLQAELLDFMV